MSTNRLGQAEWIAAARAAMERGGLSAVRVDVLATALGVSRGSFYWHFENRDALLRATLQAWEQELSAPVLEQVDRPADPAERFRALLRSTMADGPGSDLQTALMAHADHPIVAPILARVTESRIAFAEAILRDVGFTPAAARRRALLAYSAFLGWLELRRTPRGSGREIPAGAAAVRRLADELAELMLVRD